METTNAMKVAKTSRSSIESLENSKEEFMAMIEKMDAEISDLSQAVRMEGNATSTGTIERVNKLKIHRLRLNEMLTAMQAADERTWVAMRQSAQLAYEEADTARQ